ncbi:regulator of chromosome condensation family protein [Cryptosporidium andersoni]|uniref:Regulator of chromosome condensation family protein n=1 Tax=Cryptosporidium andersoni TaxID=117008 RepID=A0A1J4MT02_9CRYT|nr:regulator of chromosome condensation family protein [Cryptosporidium andersoni]
MGQASVKSGVVAWGSSEYGQLGAIYEESNIEPKLIESLHSFNSIKEVCCGGHHSAVITHSGELIVWGYGGCGQLGLGDLKDVVIPKIITSIKNVINVSCSDRHSAAVLEDGRLYTWGCNKSGKLGIGSLNVNLNNNIICTPQLVEKLLNEKVIKVSCGSFHTACLTDLNKAYTWGLGMQGRLGHGDTNDIYTPKLIESLAGLSVRNIVCGGHHTAILLNNGKVYFCGGGAFGKLGFGSKEDIYIPKLLQGPLTDKFIKEVSLGYQHSAVITTKGKVYTWGQGGRLGHIYNGPEPDILSPKLVEKLNSIIAVNISCGHSHTVVISNIGDVYAWGVTRNLGHGTIDSKPNDPTLHPILQNKNIVQVSCGKTHTIALSDIELLINKVNSSLTTNFNEKKIPNLNYKGDENFFEVSEVIDNLISNKIKYNMDKYNCITDTEKINYLLCELKRKEEHNIILLNLLQIALRELENLQKEIKKV